MKWSLGIKWFLVWLHFFIGALFWTNMGFWIDEHCASVPDKNTRYVNNAIAAFTWEASFPAIIVYGAVAHVPEECH